MKRDMSAKLFLLSQICGFMCNYKSINNRRYRRLKTILFIIYPNIWEQKCCFPKWSCWDQWRGNILFGHLQSVLILTKGAQFYNFYLYFYSFSWTLNSTCIRGWKCEVILPLTLRLCSKVTDFSIYEWFLTKSEYWTQGFRFRAIAQKPNQKWTNKP